MHACTETHRHPYTLLPAPHRHPQKGAPGGLTLQSQSSPCSHLHSLHLLGLPPSPVAAPHLQPPFLSLSKNLLVSPLAGPLALRPHRSSPHLHTMGNEGCCTSGPLPAATTPPACRLLGAGVPVEGKQQLAVAQGPHFPLLTTPHNGWPTPPPSRLSHLYSWSLSTSGRAEACAGSSTWTPLPHMATHRHLY